MKIPPYSLVAGVPAKIIGSSKKLLKKIEKESVSICIPSFNEAKNIEKVVKDALYSVSKITNDYELVMVNDGSTDKTGKIIDALARKNKKIKVFHHKKNKGFTGAMKTSLYSAKKNLVFLAPGDGQFNFDQLEKLVYAIRGYDMAIGYKTNSSEGLFRKLSSWAIYSLYQTLFRIPIKEISSVFLWRRRVIESVKIESDDRSAMFLYEFFFKALEKNNKYIEVPITWRSRQGGMAKGRALKTILFTLFGMAKLRVGYDKMLK
jgi:glycosyltransferase involved in cell wall biosynthesis